MQVEDAYPTANDGFQIEFLRWGGGRNFANNASSSSSSSSPSSRAPENVVILLHGWSGGPEYFQFCMQTLKHNEKTCYLAPRLRGHGCKDDAKGKFHIARLAKDVHDLIQWVRPPLPQTCARSRWRARSPRRLERASGGSPAGRA